MNNTAPPLPLPKKARRYFSLLCLFAALAAFLFSGPLQAQEGAEYGYVDLIVTYEYDSEKIAYSIRNVGTAAATGVTVSFLLEDLQTDSFVTSSSITTTSTGTNQSFTWEVGTLLPGDFPVSLKFSARNHAGHATAKRIGAITATASSNQPEPGPLLGNNVTKVYSYAASTTGASLHMEGNRLGLLLSVDDLRPAGGGDVSFGLTAISLNPQALSDYINLIDDIEIKVELSDGLEFKSITDWTRPTGFTTSGRSATWEPEAVDSKPDSDTPANFLISREITIETQLTSGEGQSLTDIPLGERCFTAWVSGSTPPHSPDYVLGSLKQCLGDDPTVLFEEEELNLFTLYPCVGVSPIAYPCRDDNNDSTVDNGLELVVGALLLKQPVLRRSGIGRYDGEEASNPNFVLRPEIVVVRVDPEARVGTKWYTGSDENSGEADDAGIIPGALVHLDFLGAAWKPYTLAISDVSPKKRPGSMALLNMGNTDFTLLDADTKTSLGPVDSAVDELPIVVVFGTLGTYEVNLTMGGTNSSTAYTSTGRYTFHVGPIAELEVRDGGGNAAVPASQRAYTIMAVNNGPDAAPAAKVTLTGLDAGSCSGNATKGSIAFADDNKCTWTIGELVAKDASQIATGRDGEVLTIITSAAAGTKINAAISNTQDYQVCIDSSGNDVELSSPSETTCEATTGNTWHTAKYYDYDDDNDSASIKAKDGTGENLPSSMRAAGVQGTAVSWGGISTLYRRAVTGYEIERSTNGGSTWIPVATVPSGTTTYVDPVQGSNLRYRVRAVNLWNHKGPWATGATAGPSGPPARPAGPPTNVSAMRSETDPAGAIKVSWEAPLDDGGSRITGYQAQWSATGTEGWSNACAASAAERSCEHTGLSEGTTRYYRVAARTARGLGQWSAPPAAASTRPAACDVAEIAADGSPVSGNWGDDCESQERAGSYARYYQFTLTESADIWVELESEDTGTVLYLREGAGATSGPTTHGGFSEGEPEYNNRRASIEASLSAGTYTVEAAASAPGQTGSFTLIVGDLGPEGCRAEKVTADGSPVAGTWGDDCESTAREGRPARYYRLTLTESADVTVVLESDDAETVLYLREGAGNTSGATTPGGFNEGESEYNYRRASIEESLAAGTYTIEATTFAAGETGDFTLTVSEAGGPGPVGCEAVAVTADGSPVAGNWGGDCESTAREERQARYYQFTLAESADITVLLESQEAETVLYLREGAGITSGATTPGGFNEGDPNNYHRASIEETLPAGTYTIEVTTFAAGETGAFTLTVSGAGVPAGPVDPDPVGCEAVEVTADGSPVAGSWGADCESTARQGRQARYYQFTLAESANITVQLESDDAETVLYLREGAGVTSGATTPGGFNEGESEYNYRRASIEESLAAGTYTIEVTTYAAGETGAFTLTVSGGS